MRIKVEFEREVDGRWIANVAELPGVLVYGPTREAALSAAQSLALRVLADQLEHGEAVPEPLIVTSLRGALSGSGLDEKDYQRHLEEKHR